MTWAAVAVTTAVVAAGCGRGDEPEAPDPQSPNASASVTRIKDKGVTDKGGTVYVLSSEDFISLDPANNYNAEDSEVGRLFTRTLTFVKDTPGEELSIQPDLAESLGTASDGGRTWTYRLREGLKYEDGRPITAADVKYGVQRSFAQDVYDEGATYMVDLLENETEYAGPYDVPAKELTSVETPDDRTIVFHFKGPQPDADWILAQLYTSPVPKDADTKGDYGKRPLASGPYKIETYTDRSFVLVRNDQWDPATDPNRPAYPDRFEVDRSPDASSIDQRLLSSVGKDANALTLNAAMSPLTVSKLDEPSVQARFINGPGLCVDFVLFDNEQITDPDVRHALALAIDRRGIHEAHGGDVFGSITDSIIPPTVEGYVTPELGLAPQGDPDAAKKLLAGKSVPPLHYAIRESSAMDRETATVIQSSFKAADVELIVDAYPDEEYSALFEGDDVPEIDYYGWCADWPTPSAVVPGVLGPDPDGKTWGSNNMAKYYDPAMATKIQALMSSTEAASVAATQMSELANEIQATAWPLLPTTLTNSPQLVGANLTNVGITALFGVVDLNTIAVKKG